MTPGVFEELLKDAMGLHPVAVGRAVIARAVHERMAAGCVASEDAYAALVLSSERELQELVEAVAVCETWFFRNPAAFSELASAAVLAAGAPDGPVLRFLSVPCSSGEEPYSMAMALLDAGLPASRFRIEAVDISRRIVALAERGVYGANSFRGPERAFRARHFVETSAGFALSDAVRAQVTFERGNLLAPGFRAGAAPYDAIFCRNLLIYFDPVSQVRAIGVLRELLGPNGILCVGPAEAGLLAFHGFVWSKKALAFCFRRPSEPSESSKSPKPSARDTLELKRKAMRPLAPELETPRTARREAVVPPALSLEHAPAPDLDDAARLADLGHLREAAESCEAHVLAHGPTARALHLRGLIFEAGGSLREAGEHFRKALYLEPSYVEAIVHLALLSENTGDLAGARLLRQRLQRLEGADGFR